MSPPRLGLVPEREHHRDPMLQCQVRQELTIRRQARGLMDRHRVNAALDHGLKGVLPRTGVLPHKRHGMERQSELARRGLRRAEPYGNEWIVEIFVEGGDRPEPRKRVSE